MAKRLELSRGTETASMTEILAQKSGTQSHKMMCERKELVLVGEKHPTTDYYYAKS